MEIFGFGLYGGYERRRGWGAYFYMDHCDYKKYKIFTFKIDLLRSFQLDNSESTMNEG